MAKGQPLTDADRSLFREAVRDAKPLPHHGKALRKKVAPPPYPVQSLRKLRSGTWVIQNQLDLHGLDRHEARAALVDFLSGCVKRGVRCVRVIHGKGLGSKNREPVLKTKVKHWLTQRDEVLAYCQARPVDGGSGAVVVLLKGAAGKEQPQVSEDD
jgi:DNA-nicking Smr family endonuclease